MPPDLKPTLDQDPKLDLPDITDLHLARARIQRQINLTPVLKDADLNRWAGCKLALKCENLQRTGSFKFRGASNAVMSLAEDLEDEPQALAEQCVATHSSGNHGAALSLAARLAGWEAHVVMPENSVRSKVEAVRRYGGTVHFCAPGQRAREAGLDELVGRGMTPIPPFDCAEIIAGQGSCALEFLGQENGLEVLVVPIGGGGLISGTAIAAHAQGVAVIGVEPEGAADTLASLENDERVEDWDSETIADGLRAVVGVRNFELIRKLVKKVVTVSDDEIRAAQAIVWRYLRLVVEPSSSTVLAAVAKYPQLFGGKQVGLIISGGNVLLEDWCRTVKEAV